MFSRPSTPITSTSQISHPAHTLLQQAHPTDIATAIFTDKIKNKPLLLQPSTIAQRDKRSLRRHIRLRKKQHHLQHQRPRPLSAKEKRETGIHDLKPEEVKYDIYKNLNLMWIGYILEVLGLTTPSGEVTEEALDGRRTITALSAGSLIASADYHGMEIEVTRAKDVGRVGLKGIVVRDTRSTFVVVTKKDRCVRVMKEGCVFKITIDLAAYAALQRHKLEKNETTEEGEDMKIGLDSTKQNPESNQGQTGRTITLELHGSQIEYRPADRAIRKMKWKNMDYL